MLVERQKQVLYDKKWKKFLKRTWLFRHLPFIEFVFGAGSLAVGNVQENSDFDVIIGVKSGRIFTARFFAILVFGFFGWRRHRLSHHEAASDKICLNHFITQASYTLKGPYTASWRELYQNLVPVWGEKEKIREFKKLNKNWINSINLSIFQDDLRYDRSASSFMKFFFELMLGGYFGNFIERMLKILQIKKIEKSLLQDPPGFAPRICYNDLELEFHPDRQKFEV